MQVSAAFVLRRHPAKVMSRFSNSTGATDCRRPGNSNSIELDGVYKGMFTCIRHMLVPGGHPLHKTSSMKMALYTAVTAINRSEGRIRMYTTQHCTAGPTWLQRLAMAVHIRVVESFEACTR